MDYRVAVLLLAALGAFGQQMRPACLKRSVKPAYSQEARENGVQGTVVFHAIIGANGKLSGIELVSPLGFGLDERAQASLQLWEFEPAKKDGVAVDLETTIEVSFRLMGRDFDDAAEKRRSDFNASRATILNKESGSEARERARRKIEDLSAKKYAPAMTLVGTWRLAGENGPKDEPGGLELIRLAAGKRHGPALYQIALRRMKGTGLPRDTVKGLEEMREAATLGSVQAQFYLAGLYELGSAVTQNFAVARQHYRMCASQGVGQCQYKLGKLMLQAEDRREHVRIQAIAWLELAAEQESLAAALARKETAGLSAEQMEAVKRLKGQLVRK